MNTNVRIRIDPRGVMMHVTVPRYVFDEINAHAVYSGEYECVDESWQKTVVGGGVVVVFTTYEPPRERV